MANPFARMAEYFTAPNRNTHDCSFTNNLTMEFGKLYPCFYQDVVPGEAFRINPTFRLNFQPLIFPVQTRMRAHMHFFYCRTKDVYKDWLDKFGMTKEGLEMPYMKLTEENRDMVNTCELGDYLNIPTVTYGSFANTKQQSFYIRSYFPDEGYDLDFVDIYSEPNIPPLNFNPFTTINSQISVDDDINFDAPTGFRITLPLSELINVDSIKPIVLYFQGTDSQWPDAKLCFADASGSITHIRDIELEIGTPTLITVDNIPKGTSYIYIYSGLKSGWSPINVFSGSVGNVIYFVDTTFGLENKDLSLDQLPFCSVQNPDGERLTNLPFRFYEFVYNSFYRDERNNPYKIDGQVEYNKYLPSTEGGADTYHYQLRKVNWEQDFLTTATTSPQLGVAPLVGVTATGTMTFADEEGRTYTAQAKVGDDGDTITGISVHSPDMPVGTLRALIDTVSTGISISDFRNVNALQRLLEKRMRHGLKYVDMVQASYGTRPKNLEISMPEFIGGVNEDVIVNRISQTVDTESVPLGTLGGQAGVLGTSEHPISCYCDDFGCIIGLMYIAPVPNYSQLLPKYWLRREALDFFHPEFGHIGYQPIYNKEVAPLQFYRDDKVNDTDNYNSVFGYQRPWYDYISKTDEVHGNFRNNMRRYLINRVFDTPPALTEDFLLIDPKQINDVFAVTSDSHKIFGEVFFKCKRKNAVPTLSIPRLES